MVQQTLQCSRSLGQSLQAALFEFEDIQRCPCELTAVQSIQHGFGVDHFTTGGIQ